MAAASWEFWIDVGGTFTDCLVKPPDGEIRRHKLLSSGVTKGRVGGGSSRQAIVDRAGCNDPAGFWTGWRLSIVGTDGGELDRAVVTAFDPQAGVLQVDGLERRPTLGAAYELRCDLDAPVVAIRYLLGLRLAEPVAPVVLRLGTTRGTNALVTRSGARTALVTTRGFGDVLEIGYQARPRLFDLTIRKPSTLASVVIEIDERVTYDGDVLAAPKEAAVRQQLQSLVDAGVESIAVCLLHADRHHAHEAIVGQIAREVGLAEISLSHLVAPLPKFVARADTTVVDAYLNPVLREYVSRLRTALPDSKLRILTSAGGLVGAEHFCGKDSILSGPAGGVVGFSSVAKAAGYSRAIGFDMGGTSTDVSRFDGRFELEYETQKAGVRLVAPAMAIETVAAERKVRTALARLPVGTHSFTDYLETAEGVSTPICVQFTIHPTDEKLAATIDFTGTGPVIAGNLNANRAIVTAAVIYVLRVLVNEDIPLNHGVLRPIEIVLPNCLLNPKAGSTPETTPAVAGGNVETSQRVVDVLLGALGIAAASQGTMNNVVFGDQAFGFYETICGGSGATADGPGASAVQVHMTNTRLTDPEILERRYPVRVREFSIRRGSGGNGAHRGGDGVVRRLEFLRPLTLSLLTQRRGPHPPYGMAGGESGALGVNRLIRAGRSEVRLGGITQVEVVPGDILIIETPGGGGFGQG